MPSVFYANFFITINILSLKILRIMGAYPWTAFSFIHIISSLMSVFAESSENFYRIILIIFQSLTFGILLKGYNFSIFIA